MSQREYTLNEKGNMLEPVLELLGEFSMRFESATVFEDGKPLDFEDVFGTVNIPYFSFLLADTKLFLLF